MYGLILCAGQGSRMQPLSDLLPKPLLPIDHKPVISWTIEAMLEFPVDRIGLVIQAQDRPIFLKFLEQYFPDNSIDLFIQKELTGITTAIQTATSYQYQPLLVCAGDTQFLTHHLAPFFESDHRVNTDLIIGIRRRIKKQIMRRSMVVVDDNLRVLQTIEKPTEDQITSSWSGVPLWYFSAECWSLFNTVQPSNNGEYTVEGVIQQVLDRGDRVTGIEVTDSRDITTPSDVIRHNFSYVDTLLKSTTTHQSDGT